MTSELIVNQLKAFSTSGALEIRHVSETKPGSNIQTHRVYLDAAQVKSVGTKEYAWNNKVTLLLSLEEMMKVASSFLLIAPFCELKGRKVKSSSGHVYKNLFIETQAKNIYVRVGTKSADGQPANDQLVTIPVSFEMSGALGMLMLNAIAMSIPGNTAESVLTSLRLIAAHRSKL